MATLTRRDAALTVQPPCAQHDRKMDTFPCGLEWHGPIYVVGPPNRSDGYGRRRPAPTLRVCALWSRGIIPGTRVFARVAARCTASTAFLEDS